MYKKGLDSARYNGVLFMEKKKLHKLLSILLCLVLISGTLPLIVSADETHTHTEECYAVAGQLLCTIPESEEHAHGDECYAEGGELICGQREDDETDENLEEDDDDLNVIPYDNSEEDPDSDDEPSGAVTDAGDFAAIKAAVENLAASDTDKTGTIRIIANISFPEQLTVPAGVSVTIISDEDGHTINKTEDAEDTELFKVEDGADLTIDGDLTFLAVKDGKDLVSCQGKLTLKQGVFDFGGKGISDASGIISVSGKNAEFIMEGGTIKNAYINACCGGVRICSGGSFTMNGGTICDIHAGGSLEAGAVLVFAINNANIGNGPATFTLNGGTIENNTGYRGAGVFVGGRDFYYRASMTMNGGTIRNNKCQGFDNNQGAGAGVYVQANAEFTMNDGEISGNEVTLGLGGGVSVACGWESVAGTAGWDIERYSRYYPAAFTMNGGSITNNKAMMNKENGDNGCGGGIYVASNCVTLNGGLIENNYAEKQGGGVYVGATPYVLKIHNAVVKENHATVLGGGLWACPTGDVELFVTNGAALYDNISDGAGDDLVSVKIPSKAHVLTLADRALGAGQVFWYKDGGVDNSSVLGTPDGSDRYNGESGAEPLNPICEYGESIALKAVMSDNAKASAMKESTLLIRGNESPRGGGIGTNGGIILGDEKENDYRLKVSKTWTDAEDNLKVPVTIYLKLGEYILDSVELNEDNNWTGIFEDLPDPASVEPRSYTAVEIPVPESFSPEYTAAETDADTCTISITVNNRYTPCGSLAVSKTVAGNAGDTSRDFSFKVTLEDNAINGNYGDVTFADGVAEFTLKHGEQKTAVNLPAGVKYTVTESEADKDGYTTTSTGATGSIVKNQTAAAVFTNIKNIGGHGGDSHAYGNLTVSKTVTGDAGDKNRKFTFTITLDRGISGQYGDMSFDRGVSVIKLGHNESSTAAGLPSGIHYSVTESDNEGYEVSAAGEIGTICAGKTAAAAFTNNKEDLPVKPDGPGNPDKPNNPGPPDESGDPVSPDNQSDDTPQTGDTSYAGLWLSLMVISFAAFACVCIYGIRRRYIKKKSEVN